MRVECCYATDHSDALWRFLDVLPLYIIGHFAHFILYILDSILLLLFFRLILAISFIALQVVLINFKSWFDEPFWC